MTIIVYKCVTIYAFRIVHMQNDVNNCNIRYAPRLLRYLRIICTQAMTTEQSVKSLNEKNTIVCTKIRSYNKYVHICHNQQKNHIDETRSLAIMCLLFTYSPYSDSIVLPSLGLETDSGEMFIMQCASCCLPLVPTWHRK